MKTQAIIPTAGSGTRLKSKTIKSLIKINGKPLFVFCLEIFEKSAVESVILVVPKAFLKEFERHVKKYRLKKVKTIVPGGPTRSQSVKNGLAALDFDTKIVMVHDGVRPLVTVAMINRSIQLCQRHKAVIVAVPVKPTIKSVNTKSLTVKKTLPREELWEVQTPQTFDKDLLKKAHAQSQKDSTDDALLVERLGKKIKVLPGDYQNIKVTTKEDLEILKAFLRR